MHVHLKRIPTSHPREGSASQAKNLSVRINLEEYLSPTKRGARGADDDDIVDTDVAMETRVARKDYRRVWEQDDVMVGDKKRDTFFDRLKQTYFGWGLHHIEETTMILTSARMRLWDAR